jgi:catechol 2,3-dioxygenase-like lactoylglutathione lyase family enzyme
VSSSIGLTRGRRERADCDVVPVRIPKGELRCLRVRVHVRLLFEPGDERTCPLQYHVEIVDAEEQEEPVARSRLARTHQRGMVVRAPPVEAEQDGSIRIQNLTKVIMFWSRLELAEERLVPFETAGDIAYANDRPCTFHRVNSHDRTDISGIAPFVIARNVPAALSFYRDRLGFDITFQGPEPDDIFFGIVQRGAAMIMFKDVGVDPVPNYTRDIKQGIARWDAYLHVPDPDALAAEFLSRDVEFFVPLKDTGDGLRGFELKDADGYVLFFGRPRS